MKRDYLIEIKDYVIVYTDSLKDAKQQAWQEHLNNDQVSKDNMMKEVEQ